MIVKKLKPEQFTSQLASIFRKEFDSSLPWPENADIFAAVENGRILGFVVAEKVVMLGQIYVIPALREHSTEIVNPMIRTLRDEFDGKENVGAVASEPRFGSLFESLGMEKIDGEFYRKNRGSEKPA